MMQKLLGLLSPEESLEEEEQTIGGRVEVPLNSAKRFPYSSKEGQNIRDFEEPNLGEEVGERK